MCLVLLVIFGQDRCFGRHLHLVRCHVLLDATCVQIRCVAFVGHVLLTIGCTIAGLLPFNILLNDLLLLLKLLLITVLELIVLPHIKTHVYVRLRLVKGCQFHAIMGTSRRHLLLLRNLRGQLFDHLLLLSKLSLFLCLPVLCFILLCSSCINLLDITLKGNDLFGQVIDVL